MKTSEDIRRILHVHKDELRRRYGSNGLSVFGSVVRGEARDDSDVDLLTTFDRPVGLLKLIDVEYYLGDLLGVKVDIIPSGEVRPELQEQIRMEAVSV